MIALLIMADISRCALPSLCPTDAQLLAAVRGRDAAAVWAVSTQLSQESPDDIVTVHSERIRRVSDALCGDKVPGEQDDAIPRITCKFTIRYWTHDAHTVARMALRDGEWVIEDALAVTRSRR